ncbi:MAG TPA: heme-binding domain-containing protein [Bacteroidota bacterium]|nr:heme-binding domain-containing protein [Bacteroidota bacterium]
MKILKRIVMSLAGLLVVIQFIRPEKNVPDGSPLNDIGGKFTVPEDVVVVLRTSCYDCHSNETRYPWYAEIQPVGWWLNDHIHDAKEELNFSEFANYRPRRQYRKFEEITDQVKEGEMPLPSYLILHNDAKLSPAHKERLTGWANSMRDSLKAMYPLDSLERTR